MTAKKAILDGLRDSVVSYDLGKAKKLADEAIATGVDAKEAITVGLSEGMNIVGEKYEHKEMYLPEVMAASQAMYAAMDILMPHLKTDSSLNFKKKIQICTVEGDVHSIGKTIVGTLMKVAGYEVNDLGADVPLTTIIETAEKDGVDLIAMSTLMTSTMAGMEDVMKMLADKGIRSKYKIAVGGAPVNEDFRVKIGADMTATNAETAVKIATKMFGGA
ncbi:MAG: corrinoid protein [Methanomassiliicoccus sp.]|nr:corrinoid protein [Methanomassiliicoccus sp.]